MGNQGIVTKNAGTAYFEKINHKGDIKKYKQQR